MSLEHPLPRKQLNTRGLLLTFVGASLGAFLLLLPMLASNEDWAGWLFLYLSPFALLAFPEFRANRRLFYVGLLVLAAHHVVAIFNNVVGIGLFAVGDPMNFHRDAGLLAVGEDNLGAHNIGLAEYIFFLSFFYRIFEPNLFLGGQVSILVFAISCGVFARLMNEWGIRREQPLYMLLYGLLPAVIMFTSVTLREACEMLMFQLCVLNALRLRSNPTSLRAAGLFFSIILLALLHNGLMPFGAIFFLMCLLWAVKANPDPRARPLWVAGMAIVATIAGVGAAFAQRAGDTIKALVTGKILLYLITYRLGLKGFEGTRANYDIPMDINSPLSIVSGTALSLIYYLLAPFPWQVENAMDLYVMLEGWLRVALLLFGIVAWRRSQGETRSRYGFLLLAIFILETLWGVGTGNWGTGVRHHVLVWGTTLMVGGPGFLHWISRQYRALVGLPPPPQN